MFFLSSSFFFLFLLLLLWFEGLQWKQSSPVLYVSAKEKDVNNLKGANRKEKDIGKAKNIEKEINIDMAKKVPNSSNAEGKGLSKKI